MENQQKFKTSIGGQALLEGIMMRGPKKTAMAVRRPDGGIELEYLDPKSIKDKSKILIVGDSQSSDILGGINSGIDTCWFNPKGKKGEYYSKFEIKDLEELTKILK